MRKSLLIILALLLSVSGFAQDQSRYKYFLCSDSILEMSNPDYLDRDTVGFYGFYALTGDVQYFQITDKPAYVICYDAVLDSAFYLYAYSAVYSYNESTGEYDYWMGEWNPSSYNQANNMGWKNVKNSNFPYYYLWWTMQDYTGEGYYAFGLEPGMYMVQLCKEDMIDDDPIILLAKIDNLNPVQTVYHDPRIQYYKYTQHTTSSGTSSGGGYSKYGSLYNYNAFTCIYDISHSRSHTSTSTYYTWDRFWLWDFRFTFNYTSYKNYMIGRGPMNGMMAFSVTNDPNTALTFYIPKDNTEYGVVRSSDYDTRIDAYWYDLVPFTTSPNRNFLTLDLPKDQMFVLWDWNTKRVALITKDTYYDILSPMSYDDVYNYINWSFVNFDYTYYDPDGGDETRPMTVEEVKQMIDEYEKIWNDPVGAQKLREFAFGTEGIEALTADEDAPYYNLQGMKVNPSTPGIYIRNGKKVLVK